MTLSTDTSTRDLTTEFAAASLTVNDKTRLRAYFPHIGTQNIARVDVRSLPERPTEIGPIFDQDRTQQPLPEYTSHWYAKGYGETDPDGLATIPTPPIEDADPYLVPALASEERLRLTVLWYYTRRIEQDLHLLSKLDTLAKTVQQTVDWEFAIIGVLDEAVYTRLATANLPIALLPRRESTCSHTINQAPRSVFMSTDMSKDWRFRESPHVKIGGLRSYAGTQLIVTTDDGQEVALGSLCVASNSIQTPLSRKQREALVRFADIISWEIIDRTRQLRFKERSTMTGVLLRLQAQTENPDFESMLIANLQQMYPEAQVSLLHSTTGGLPISDQDTIPFAAINGNLWEDTDFIEEAIRTTNYKRLISIKTIRAAVARCSISQQYLVIAISNVQHVLDDIDAWFVEKCAGLFTESLTKRQLIQALNARDRFLRNITHQLRTPIHGILASVDLLSEDMTSREISMPSKKSDVDTVEPFMHSSYVAAIRSSGRELMSTVNNILKFNTLTTYQYLEGAARANYDLRYIGGEMVAEALQLVPVDQMQAVSIQVVNKLPHTQCIISMEERWLKDCVQPLLVNSLHAVTVGGCGTVTITVGYETQSQSLFFDVKDTGIGIKPTDRERIFNAFEKIDDHKSGPGLGLTLASKIAAMHEGSITLLASIEGFGSHFRATFLNQNLSALSEPVSDDKQAFKYLPKIFHKMRGTFDHIHMLTHLNDYLIEIGAQECNRAEAALIITDLSPKKNDFIKLFETAEKPVVVIHYGIGYNGPKIEKLSKCLTAIHTTGPFCTYRLLDLLHQADLLYGDMITTDDTTRSSVTSPRPVPRTSDSTSFVHQKDSRRLSNQIVIEVSLRRALLVDDNTINLRILEMFCQKRSIPYVTATDGLKAEEEFHKAIKISKPFNLILMDLQMPVCDGIQATCAIRLAETEQALTRAAIFMITGQDSLGDRLRSKEAGVDEFLVKPVSVKTLHRHIEKYFGAYAK